MKKIIATICAVFMLASFCGFTAPSNCKIVYSGENLESPLELWTYIDDDTFQNQYMNIDNCHKTKALTDGIFEAYIDYYFPGDNLEYSECKITQLEKS